MKIAREYGFEPLFKSFELVGNRTHLNLEEEHFKCFEYVFTPGEFSIIGYKDILQKAYEQFLNYKKEVEKVTYPLFIYTTEEKYIKSASSLKDIAKKIYGDIPYILMKYEQRVKKGSLLDYDHISIIEEENLEKLSFVDGIFLSTTNRDPEYQIIEKVVKSNNKLLEEFFIFNYGSDKDPRRSKGLHCKLGHYLVDSNLLPEGVIYKPSNNIKEEYEVIESYLGEGSKIMKLAFGHNAGGYAVLCYSTPQKFENNINKFRHYALANNIDLYLIVQKTLLPFMAFKSQKEAYAFFIRIFPLLEENAIKYLVTLKHSGDYIPIEEEDTEKRFQKMLSKNNQTLNLSGGLTGFLFLIYDPEKKDVELIETSSKTSIKVEADIDKDIVYVGECKLSLREGLTLIAHKGIKELEKLYKNVSSLAQEFKHNPEMHDVKFSKLEDMLNAMKYPIIGTSTIKSL